MNRFVDSLVAGSTDDAVRTTALLSHDDLVQKLRSLTENEIITLSNWTLRSLSNHHINSVFTTGGLLHLLRSLVPKKQQRPVLRSAASELDISETKAYDSITIFKGFGRPLTSHPELVSAFSLEALKRLSAKAVPEAAREAAIEEAKRGDRITAQRADEIVLAHRTPSATALPAPEVAKEVVPSNAEVVPTPVDHDGEALVAVHDTPSVANPDEPLLEYQGEAVVVTVTPMGLGSHCPFDLVERDLHAALDLLKEQYLTNPDAA